MTDISNYIGDALLNWLQNSGTILATKPITVYASLWNGDPDAGGTEVTQTISLTRQAISWAAVSSHSMASNADITFGTASGSATVTYVAIHDSSTAGNLMCRHNISSVAISNAQVVKILSGNLTVAH